MLAWTAIGPGFKSRFGHLSIVRMLQDRFSWADTEGSPVSSLNCDSKLLINLEVFMSGSAGLPWFDVGELVWKLRTAVSRNGLCCPNRALPPE